ncbi:hypothetical protein WH47_08933 [Habropoda laboriosa]|uniref:Uncharacterized protein n=1 Tax=Habropoda laboriosa TaxID=597456 RepID=A0A0L7R6N7_9HYME|nr:hypothetical protein WH47_08933 [Habropoda laboriosa]
MPGGRWVYLPPNRAHTFSGVIDSHRAQRMRWSGGRVRSKVGSDEHLVLVLRVDLMEYAISTGMTNNVSHRMTEHAGKERFRSR